MFSLIRELLISITLKLRRNEACCIEWYLYSKVLDVVVGTAFLLFP